MPRSKKGIFEVEDTDEAVEEAIEEVEEIEEAQESPPKVEPDPAPEQAAKKGVGGEYRTRGGIRYRS